MRIVRYDGNCIAKSLQCVSNSLLIIENTCPDALRQYGKQDVKYKSQELFFINAISESVGYGPNFVKQKSHNPTGFKVKSRNPWRFMLLHHLHFFTAMPHKKTVNTAMPQKGFPIMQESMLIPTSLPWG